LGDGLLSGWSFQTFFIFHNIWDNPSHWLIFFMMVETTNHIIVLTTLATIVSDFTNTWMAINPDQESRMIVG